jgi:hypothetical protein
MQKINQRDNLDKAPPSFHHGLHHGQRADYEGSMGNPNRSEASPDTQPRPKLNPHPWWVHRAENNTLIVHACRRRRSHEPENEMAPPQIHRNGGRDERASANLTRETNGAGRTGSRRAGLPRLCRRGWAGRSDDEHAEQERLRLGEGFLLPVVVDEGCLFIDRTEDTLKGYAAVLFGMEGAMRSRD